MGIGEAQIEESSPAPVKLVTASKDHPGPDRLVGATRRPVWLFSKHRLPQRHPVLGHLGWVVLLVTLAETTPVLEAAHLRDDLRRAGIEPWAWVINQSVAEAHPESALLRQRAHNERAEIEAVAHHHARRYAVVPLLKQEPIGVDRLRNLIHPQPVAIPLGV